MKNVTITLDEEVADWSRVRAARDRVSLSRWIGEMLKQKMKDEAGYQQAMEDFFSQDPVNLKNKSGYPSRNELYER